MQELGLDMSDAALYWCSVSHDWKGGERKDREWYVVIGSSYQSVGMMRYESIPVYTLHEVLDKLPRNIKIHEIYYSLYIDFHGKRVAYTTLEKVRVGMSHVFKVTVNETLMNAAYNMLCWVIENGYLKEE